MYSMDKSCRINEVRGPVDTEAEVRRRLPEVDAIYDDELRELTIEYFMKATPAYFWDRPASLSGNYHPPDESEERGLWLHTKRVFAAYVNLSESFAEMRAIMPEDRNYGKVAALLHDTYQGGWQSEPGEYAEDHDVICSRVAKNIVGMPDGISQLVSAHMGPWGSGKTPETNNEILLHMADLCAADQSHTPAVYYPAEELQEQFPDLREIIVEEDERI